MGNRLAHALKRKGTLTSFFTIGYPSLSASEKVADALVEGGTDILEVGIPFSDPLSDGPAIQLASSTAIKTGATTKKCFAEIAKIRKKHPEIPIVILTYYNKLLSLGVETFVHESKKAGVDAILAADLNIGEGGEFERACRKYGIKTVYTVALNTPARKIAKIAARTTGFLYLVSVFGVTGTRRELPRELAEAIRKAVRPAGKPILVGFGISAPSQVKSLSHSGAFGVIIGSAYTKLIAKGSGKVFKKLTHLSKLFKSALVK
ncbi:tryptophan synthase subunit alpha [Candidatus Micrarchaeota archaeon CG1_02_47_40]|nr:MAG: tryptophan synthase subunit alpha [Candidatus Micrarchaeota archaeon CG1_02_47_40]